MSEVISELCVVGEAEPHRYEIVKLLLDLGADPNQTDNEGSGSLTDAMIAMDTEMLRILLDAGALPNEFSGFGGDDTLYDWAVMDYLFYVWDINKIPEEVSEEARSSEDAWLKWIDALAMKYKRRRPDHLFLLRQYGARGRFELK